MPAPCVSKCSATPGTLPIRSPANIQSSRTSRCTLETGVLRAHWSLRYERLGIEPRHVRGLLEQLQLYKRALERRKRLRIEPAVAAEHADGEVVFPRHDAGRKSGDLALDAHRLL